MRMGKRAVLLLTVVAAMLLACAGVVLAQSTTPNQEKTTPDPAQPQAESQGGKGKVVPGQYIVVLKDNQDADKVSKEHKDKLGAEVKHVYKNAIKGYAAKLSDDKLQKVKNDSRVLYVSEDRVVEASAPKTTASKPRTTALDTIIDSGPSGTVNDASASFTYHATVATATFQCSIDSGPWSDCTQQPQTYSALKPGSHTFKVKATDTARGTTDTSPASRTWTVDVQEAPTVTQRIGATDTLNQNLLTNNKGTGVGVAVIDTGIDLTHPDLQDNVQTQGKNCLTGEEKPGVDDNGHGTHVAGTIAARDNRIPPDSGIGVVGVAPEAKLYAVKVLNSSGSGTWSQVICGIDWVTSQNTDKNADGTLNTANDIKVANMSLGSTGTVTGSKDDCTNDNNDALHQAICKSVNAGVTYPVAAGNKTIDATNYIPAGYDEVITVSALSDSNGTPDKGGNTTCSWQLADETFATFSNYGAPVDIAAPGVCIRSTWLNGGYNTISGTSMATPHVAGAAALYLATHPGTSPNDVKLALQESKENYHMPGDGDSIDEGIVNVRSF